MEIQESIALAPITTFRIGGPARFFCVAKTLDDIRQSLDFARDQHTPVFILGGGSNVLVPDEGFDGLVIKLECMGVEVVREGTRVVITAGAGESWDALVARAVAEDAWGIENLSGIPGTVGGACVQNIGAYGAAFSQVLESIEVFDTNTREIKTLSREECALGYRGSIFKEEDGRYIVLHATLVLQTQPAPNISYKDLKARFADMSMDLSSIRAAVLEIRAAKFPDLSVEGTAGSFFKNPIMPKAEAEALKQTYPDMPLFDMPETEGVKVPLAWLLDHALHLKGTEVGGARLFENQVLVIAAKRGTSSHDVQELASHVQEKVFSELKIKIEPEVKIL
ncbi:MAG TPA: UDP-N-acetylmuramate dehydrogenase [Candidatus Paceibacterota bacterium]|nr:UDP-N-acetylmuramate dehydrogenase [Candidatus Paceibacterota bacterium]